MPRVDSFPDQVFKANSDEVLLEPVRDSVVLTPLTKVPHADSGQAETCDLPAVIGVKPL